MIIMNFESLKTRLGPWKPSFLLERRIPIRYRLFIKIGLLIFTVLALFLSTSGLFLIFLSLLLVFVLLDFFYYSYCFKYDDVLKFGHQLAVVVFNTPNNDITCGFLSSSLGREVIIRSGIDEVSLNNFLANARLQISSDQFKLSSHPSIAVAFLEGLWDSDPELKKFVLEKGVIKEEFMGAGIWTLKTRQNTIELKRWWSREKLLSVDPLGRSWSYGTSYSLLKYARPLMITTPGGDNYHLEEAKLLEVVLSRSHGANALLVGDDGAGKMEVLGELHRLIDKGLVSSELKDKEIWVFEVSTLDTISNSGQFFQQELTKVLKESERAGNIILVIPNMSAFLVSGNRFAVSVLTILSPFIVSSKMQVVGISNTREYQERLEPIGDIKQHFEKITVHPPDENTLASVLESEVTQLERQTGIVVSYPALTAALSSAKKYFVDRVMSDVANDLLTESAAKAKSEGKRVVDKDTVLSIVKSKTGIPTGVVKEEEKDKLLNLETLLKERIVGQEEAIKVVSGAIRRARSGVGNPSRPAGSFLFLGPTGVGKTESAKALGEVFFGESFRLMRLDMSEYNSFDSLNRLIGSSGTDTAGTLVTLLRENPYGVLLLDEFEKADTKVTDLFLQILDEGIFSDMRGEKVSARNCIIIATSNAGSDLIFEYVRSGNDLSKAHDSIINEIISRGTFKPELLNRFDGIVLFRPLTEENLKEVSKRLLSNLTKRLKEKGITLKVTDSLIQFLVQKGLDPKFGARPLNRAIQETVEQIIAKKMISGEISSGSEVEFTESDFR